MQPASAVLQRRENGKLEKRRRINAAARAVFSECGYKGASMREIAKRAGVATGTLFLYAPDKRNLLLWVVNEDLVRITEETFAAIAPNQAKGDLLDQLMFVFEARYRYWGTDPDLSLHALQGLVIRRDVESSPVLDRPPQYDEPPLHPQRFAMREHITGLIIAQQQRGHIRATEDPVMVAHLLLAIFNAEMRNWLRSKRVDDVAYGIGKLRTLMRLAIEGCGGPIARGAGGRSN